MGSIKVRKPLLNACASVANNIQSHRKMSLKNVELGRVVGTGNFAKVYSATHRPSGNALAVKVIDNTQPHTARSVTTEVNALSKVPQHKNIITLYSHSSSSSKAYLFLEYLPFPNLGELLNKHGPVDENVARTLIRQLCDALIKSHAVGVAHHDIKADNIIVTNEGVLKLIDWGLAIDHKNPDVPCTEFSGSPLYLPPEVLNHNPYNPFLADIWSIGVLTYELLCGVVPFESDSYDELVHLANTQEVYFPREFSPKLVDFLSGLLTKDPSKRFTLNDIVQHPWLAPVSK